MKACKPVCLCAMLVATSFLPACATASRGLATSSETPWASLESGCETAWDSDLKQRVVVRCDRDAFLLGLTGCVRQGGDLAECEARLAACDAVAGIDRDVQRGQLAECEARLASPWRSIWLPGLLGVAAGAVLTAVVVGAAR